MSKHESNNQKTGSLFSATICSGVKSIGVKFRAAWDWFLREVLFWDDPHLSAHRADTVFQYLMLVYLYAGIVIVGRLQGEAQELRQQSQPISESAHIATASSQSPEKSASISSPIQRESEYMKPEIVLDGLWYHLSDQSIGMPPASLASHSVSQYPESGSSLRQIERHLRSSSGAGISGADYSDRKADQQRQRDSAVSAASVLLGGTQSAEAKHSASEASGVGLKNAGANNCMEKNNDQP